MRQTITLPEVLASTRKAIEDGTLALLTPSQCGHICQYSYFTLPFRCSIGTALNEETLSKLKRTQQGMTVVDIIFAGVIDAPAIDIPWLHAIQRMHDTGMQIVTDLETGSFGDCSFPLYDWLKEHDGVPVTIDLFKEFLDFVEKEYAKVYPAPGAQAVASSDCSDGTRDAP